MSLYPLPVFYWFYETGNFTAICSHPGVLLAAVNSLVAMCAGCCNVAAVNSLVAMCALCCNVAGINSLVAMCALCCNVASVDMLLSIELDYIFTGMLKAAQMTVNCPEQPGNS